MGLLSQTQLSDFTLFHFHALEKGNGNPLECSCLESPRDKGAWWAAVYGVAQSWKQLKWFRSRSVYMPISTSQFIPPPFPTLYPYVCFPCVCLYFFFVNKFIWDIFLDSTYKCYYMIFDFLFLTYFTLYDSRSTSLEMAQICSLIWLSNSPLHIYTPSSLAIPLLMNI